MTTKQIVTFVIVVAIVFSLLCFSVWFQITHRCVASHSDIVQHCTTYGVNSNNPWTTCYPVEVDVCDEWEER